ncbi:MAG: hypothetical protein CSA86_01770 [Arcobacter sp.]|nr:MAG: hypothetical protein CSA86_01770 [Arcobacter sp.]
MNKITAEETIILFNGAYKNIERIYKKAKKKKSIRYYLRKTMKSNDQYIDFLPDTMIDSLYDTTKVYFQYLENDLGLKD